MGTRETIEKVILTAPHADRQGIPGPNPAHRTEGRRLGPSDPCGGGWGVATAPPRHRRRFPPALRYLRRLPPQPGLASLPSPKGRGRTLALINDGFHLGWAPVHLTWSAAHRPERVLFTRLH